METSLYSPDKQILPEDVHSFYLNSRSIQHKPFKGPVLSLRSDNGFYYQECYLANNNRPGSFSGSANIRKNHERGDLLFSFNYGGGLSFQGLTLGEETIYSALSEILNTNPHLFRLGNFHEVPFEYDRHRYVYVDAGQIEPWGFRGVESLFHADPIIPDEVDFRRGELSRVSYTGTVFIPGFPRYG